jgi:hypothetical protein
VHVWVNECCVRLIYGLKIKFPDYLKKKKKSKETAFQTIKISVRTFTWELKAVASLRRPDWSVCRAGAKNTLSVDFVNLCASYYNKIRF